ncbi:hypothetical protein [Aggregatilinea lenta]|uniref:hypothetical protein n=1 Tax=Aggregatilinea lenta TaxID=913108 RepID=UPI0013C35609|nr:hypothetical protein [Aggregatilinea lenta]
MPCNHFTPEEIDHKRREAKILPCQGQIVQEGARRLGITEQTDYRWRKVYIARFNGISF